MELKTYSVLLAWQDNDPEQGEFGTVVRAKDHQNAERLARIDMKASYLDQYGEECLALRESDEGEEFGGRVIDIHEGAIWRALELENSLRALLTQVDETASRQGWSDHGERETARKLLDDLVS